MIDDSSFIPQKQCRRCGQPFPATPEFFYKNTSNKDGLGPYCKPCKKAHVKEWEQSHESHVRERKKVYRDAHKEHMREYKKLHYQANKEQISARGKAYRESHKEESAERARRYVETHRDQTRAYHQQYYEDHKEQVSEYNKQRYKLYGERIREHGYLYRQANIEHIRERRRLRWRTHREQIAIRRKQQYRVNRDRLLIQKRNDYARHKESRTVKNKAYSKTERGRIIRRNSWHKRELQKKAIEGTLTTEQIQVKLKAQKYACYYCFDKFVKVDNKYVFHLEHTIPVSRTEHNPRHDVNYVVLSCPTCNLKKGTKLPLEWHEGGRLF